MVMKKVFTLLFILPFALMAQDNQIQLMGSSPSLFINHKVAAKESIFSLARMYNVAPKDLAAYNKIKVDKGLTLGQAIKIPVTSQNLLQSGAAASDEATVPLYHKVEPKEGLYKISTRYNKVLMASLRKWNNLSSDVLNTGTSLIVGYLKVKKAESALAGAEVRPNEPQVAEPKPDPGPPVIFDPPQPPVKNNDNQQPPVQVPKTDPPKPVVNNEPIKPVVTSGTGDNFDGGVFKPGFNAGGTLTKQTGTAGVFKSTSGWEDGKYYCLHNTASPGIIIKVTNNATGKSVYAKVLDVIPDIKQNTGIIIRISNAAADILGVIGEAKFDCTLSYSE